MHAAEFAFIGPMVGSLARIYGGRVADRFGGGRVTLTVFGGMIAVTGALAGISTHHDHTAGATSTAATIECVACFIALFALSGLGKGAVFKLIPTAVDARSYTRVFSEPERRQWSRNMSGALIGFAAAAGAFGGVGINLALRASPTKASAPTPRRCGPFWRPMSPQRSSRGQCTRPEAKWG
ncbi:hypothetical protein MNVI_40460 [Mycobacterium noviomagense]|uniref:MFS transporter n=1 Tax=Mycobacterium noviomagense TaxID=459858 RepID=A0A7I7PJB5_9MYCO|nr:hypothetical protein BST37_21575 [Mycobacterium noviomagense]BBY08728.1 hypothetical protein MNVI_40460 [Mycobacterium noviomagense]